MAVGTLTWGTGWGGGGSGAVGRVGSKIFFSFDGGVGTLWIFFRREANLLLKKKFSKAAKTQRVDLNFPLG